MAKPLRLVVAIGSALDVARRRSFCRFGVPDRGQRSLRGARNQRADLLPRAAGRHLARHRPGCVAVFPAAAAVAGWTRHCCRSLAGRALLEQLGLLDADSLAAFVSAHPATVNQLLQHPPAAREVTGWWSGLSTVKTGGDARVGAARRRQPRRRPVRRARRRQSRVPEAVARHAARTNWRSGPGARSVRGSAGTPAHSRRNRQGGEAGTGATPAHPGVARHGLAVARRYRRGRPHHRRLRQLHGSRDVLHHRRPGRATGRIPPQTCTASRSPG